MASLRLITIRATPSRGLHAIDVASARWRGSGDVRGAFCADGGPCEARFSPDACDASFEACRGRSETFGAWTF